MALIFLARHLDRAGPLPRRAGRLPGISLSAKQLEGGAVLIIGIGTTGWGREIVIARDRVIGWDIRAIGARHGDCDGAAA